ncbi:MAG TPA: lipoprotein-releasing ABC transporter permease subunit [Candidatus Manganitrophaceae bacterium]|nr:lipoprotein-releasing ABC transporter permease subunit [Candidatus Manganitrophaceae bacterium]
MSFPYEFFVGLRYLKAKKRQKSISLNTLISIGGVTVGVAALISTLAVMTGFKEDLRDKILGTNSHVVVSDRMQEDMRDYRRIADVVTKVPHVVSATPFIFRQVLLSSDTNVFGVVLRGIDPEKEAKVTEVGKNLIEGKLEYLTRPPTPPDEVAPEGEPAKVYPGIIIGKELAGRLGAFLGDKINIVSPVGKEGESVGKSLGGPMGFTPKIRKFQVVGIFDSGMYEYDSSLAYISIPEAQHFFNLPDVVTGIEVKVDDIFIAGKVARDIEARLDFPHQARDWMKLNRNLFSALELEKVMMFVILVLIILVASFNIVSTLTMTVVEKNREIAILKAMGATRRSIMRIFMLEGLIIGGVGVILGIPLGLAVCWTLQTFYTLPGDIYYISHLPVKIHLVDVILVASSAILIGLMATIYPSWQAGKLAPVEALRYE